MPYNPTSWSLGDTITAALLNNLESGVEDAHAGDLDAGAVDTDKLADAAVTALKLAAAAVTDAKVAAGAGIDATKVADGSVSNTEFQFLGNVTSDIQAQLDSKVSAGGAVPSGVITMWSGSTNAVPSGWLLCDGNNGTPDLRDRFVVGAGGSYSVNDTGGADSVTLSTSEMPSHSHGSGSLETDFDGGHSHNASTDIRGGHSHSGTTDTEGDHTHAIHTDDNPSGASLVQNVAIFGSQQADRSTEPAGAHSHSLTTDTKGDHGHLISVSGVSDHQHDVQGNTSSRGGNAAHENRPPYYALAYIMKA